MTGINFNRNVRKETVMFPKSFRKVADALKEALSLNKSRSKCFAAFIITAVEAKSILLDAVAKRLPGEALGKSKFHRLQDFFREVRLDFNAVSRMIMGFFHHLKFGEELDRGIRRAFRTAMGIDATRTRAGELLILGYHDGIDGHTALAMYRQRWNIETGFEKLKTHGFHLESSRLRGGGKIERVLAALALATAWSYTGGLWSIKVITPIKRKKHGRAEQSIFARGLEVITALFHGIGTALRRTAQTLFALLRAAGKAAL